MHMARQETVSSNVWTIPNVISALRLLLVPVFAVLIVQEHDLWAVAVLAISGFTDWLDGVLARRLNQVSKLGQMLDPAADRLFIFVTLIGLSWRGVIPLWVLIVIALRDVLMGLLLPVLARRGYGPIPVNFVGKAATFALLYAFPLLLLASVSGWVGNAATIVGWAFAWWGMALYWWAGFLYYRQAGKLLRGTV